MDTLIAYLASTTYPGRGILMGCTPKGAALAVYFVTGRSPASLSRRMERVGGELAVVGVGKAAAQQPELIYYRALRRCKGGLIVANGDQSDTICEHISHGAGFEEALKTRRFEPDPPYFTPRISGIIREKGLGFDYELSILKAGDAKGETCLRQFFCYEPQAGRAQLVHTYSDEALTAFSGEPLSFELDCDADGELSALADRLWEALTPEYRVALYVRRGLADTEANEIIMNRNKA